ncbi:hypothetical protein Tco_1480689, partial [Tanacetum coccineum]
MTAKRTLVVLVTIKRTLLVVQENPTHPMVVCGMAGDDVGGGFGGVVMRWWSVGCDDEVMASAEDGDGRSGGSVVVVIVGEVWCSVVRSGVGGVM